MIKNYQNQWIEDYLLKMSKTFQHSNAQETESFFEYVTSLADNKLALISLILPIRTQLHCQFISKVFDIK